MECRQNVTGARPRYYVTATVSMKLRCCSLRKKGNVFSSMKMEDSFSKVNSNAKVAHRDLKA